MQQAAVAAHTAEVFRSSPFARVPRDSRSLARILDLTKQVDSRLLDRPSFVELVELLRQAEGVE